MVVKIEKADARHCVIKVFCEVYQKYARMFLNKKLEKAWDFGSKRQGTKIIQK